MAPKLTLSATATIYNIAGINFGTSGSAPNAFTIGLTTATTTPLQLSDAGTIQYLTGVTGSITETIAQPLRFQGTTYSFANNSGTGILTFSGTISANQAVAGATTLTLSGTSTATNNISGLISNGTATPLALNVTGGVWNVTASNSYTGGVTLSGGIFATNTIGASGGNQALGTNSTLNLNGGTFRCTAPTSGGNATNPAITLAIGANGGTLDMQNNFLFWSGPLTGSGKLTVLSSNSATSAWLLYTGNTTSANFSGSISIGDGVKTNCGIQYRSNNATPFGTAVVTVNAGGILTADANGASVPSKFPNDIILNGGRLGSQLPSALEYSGAITLQNGTTSLIGIPNAGSGTMPTTVSGVISGSGSITKDTSMQLTLSNANTYTGGTSIANGSITLSNSLALQNSTVTNSVLNGLLFNSSVAANAFTLGGLSGASNFVIQNTAAAPIALTIGNNNAITTYSGILSGGGSLVKTGTGTSTLTGANTFTGTTTINSNGILQLSGAGTLGNGTYAGNIAIAGTLQYSSGVTQTLSGALSGSGTLLKDQNGTLVISGANTFNGATTVNGGRLTLSGTNASTITVNSGAILGGTGATTSGIVTNSGSFISLDPANPTLALTGNAVNFAGPTQIAFDTALPLGTTSATIVKYGSLTSGITNISTTGSRATVTDDVANSQVLYSITTGQRTWNAATPGNWNLLTDANWVEGDKKFANGDVAVLDDTATNGTITLLGTILPGSVTFNNNTTPYSLSGTGTLAGGTSLVKNGTGTLILNTANSYSGITSVNAGVLNIQNAGALGSSAGGTTVASGAALQVQGGFTASVEPLTIGGTGINNDGALRNISGDNILPGLITLSGTSVRINTDANSLTLSNTGTITGAGIPLSIGGSGNTTISGIIGTGTGSLTKDGSGTTILAGNNTYTGNTTITTGTLQLGNGLVNGTISSSSTVSIPTGTRLLLNYATAAAPTTAASLAWNKITGAGTLELTTAQAANGSANWNAVGGNLTLPAAFTGTLKMNSGRVNCNPTGLGSATTFIIGNGGQFLAFDGLTAAYTYPQAITMSGVGWGEPGQDLGALRVSTETATFTGPITLAANSGLYTQGGSSGLIINNTISDGGNKFALSIAAQGSTPIQLNGANTYGGDTTFLVGTGSGTLLLGNTLALQNSTLNTTNSVGTTFNSTVAAKTFTLGGLSGTVNVNVQNTAAAAIDLSIGNNNANTLFTANLTGLGNIIKIGTGTLNLQGVNTYTGTTAVSVGTLQISGAGQLGSGSYAAAINNNATLQFSSSATQAFTGAITGTGSLIKDVGTGTLTLSGTSTTTGPVAVSAGTLSLSSPATTAGAVSIAGGTLQVGGAAVLNSGTYSADITDNGTLQYSSSANLLYSGVLSGTGALTKDTAAGILTLSKPSTFTGATSVSAGQLVLDHSGAKRWRIGQQRGERDGRNAARQRQYGHRQRCGRNAERDLGWRAEPAGWRDQHTDHRWKCVLQYRLGYFRLGRRERLQRQLGHRRNGIGHRTGDRQSQHSYRAGVRHDDVHAHLRPQRRIAGGRNGFPNRRTAGRFQYL